MLKINHIINLLILCIVSLVFIIISSCTASINKGNLDQTPNIDSGFIDISITNNTGNTTTLRKVADNKVVFMTFWASWCGPCKHELIELIEVYNEYKDKGFTVIAVNVDKPASISDAKQQVNRYAYPYEVVYDTSTELLGKLNPKANLPFSAVFDKTGKIYRTFKNFREGDQQKWREVIAQVIKNK